MWDNWVHKRSYRTVATSDLKHRDQLFLESYENEKLISEDRNAMMALPLEERKNYTRKFIGIVKPYDASNGFTEERKKFSVYLASAVAELGKAVYKMHETKHRIAQGAVEGKKSWYGSDNVEDADNLVKEAVSHARELYEVIQATGYTTDWTDKSFDEIIRYVAGFSSDEYLRRNPNEHTKFFYPIDNKRVWRHLRKLEKAAYNTVYSMFVSREEQNATKLATDAACKAYDLQKDAMRDRKQELCRMNDKDLVELRNTYVDQGNKIPKPRYSKYGGTVSEYLNSNSEEEIIKKIMEIEFSRNALLPKPDGYKEWQDEQYRLRRLEEKRIKDLAWKKIKALVSYEGGYVEEHHKWEVAVKIYKKMFGDRWNTHQEICNTIIEKIEEEKNPEGIESTV